MLVHLINPNTSTATTEMMVNLARQTAPAGLAIEGLTVKTGVPLITNAQQLAAAGEAVFALRGELTGDGVIVGAFGDPGVEALRQVLSVPVIGIGEASLMAAAASGRFSIATTTSDLEPAIRARVAALGLTDRLMSIRNTFGDAAAVMADAARLEVALQHLVDQCIEVDSATSIVIGGGPLSAAARIIAGRTKALIVEPVPAAVAWMADRLRLEA